MAYPSDTYPTAPGFLSTHEGRGVTDDLYDVITAYLADIAADADVIFDQAGNIEIASDKGVYWDSGEKISIVSGEIKIDPLHVTDNLQVDTFTVTNLTVTDDFVVNDDLTIDGDIAVTGTVTCDHFEQEQYEFTQAAEPGAPSDNTCVLWNSNGTGYGDQGDFCIKIRADDGGQTTKSITISDYSAL